MLPSFSNPYLIPDDFSVPCRVRCCDESSPCNEDSDNDATQTRQQLNEEPEEMTCTMRKWHREPTVATEFISPHRRNASKTPTKVDDAELILTQVYHRSHRRRCLSGDLSRVADTNTPVPLSKRFASFGTPEVIDQGDHFQSLDSGYDPQKQSGKKPQLKKETTILVKDIIKVHTRGENYGKKSKNVRKRSTSISKKDNSIKEECRQHPTICITTSTSRSYEFLMESTNEQLVLLTFLKVNSTKEKVSFVAEIDDEHSNIKRHNQQKEKCNSSGGDKTIGIVGESSQKDSNDQSGMEEYQSMMIESNPSNLTYGTAQSSGERSFDVEALTAKTMAKRLETESLTEKLERRFYRLVSSLDDLSSSFTKCACGCFGDSSLDNTVTIEKDTAPRRRKNTASTVSSENEKLEVDPALSTEESSAFLDSSTKQRHKTSQSPSKKLPTREELLYSQLPSGLSVEPEDLADDAPSRGGHYYASMITCDI